MTEDWAMDKAADAISGIPLQAEYGVYSKLRLHVAQALRDLAAEKDKEIARLKAALQNIADFSGSDADREVALNAIREKP